VTLIVAMNRCLPGRKLFRGLLLYGGKEVVEMLGGRRWKNPSGRGRARRRRATAKLRFFGVGAEVAVNHGGDHAEKIAAFVIDPGRRCCPGLRVR